MGRSFRSASATQSCSPRDQGIQLSRNIPELFQTQHRAIMTASRPPFGSPPCLLKALFTQELSSIASGSHSAPTPSLDDLNKIAADIKNTLLAEISDLRTDINAIASRVREVERTTGRHDSALCHVQLVTESHVIHLRELHSHLEDLKTGDIAAT